MINLGEDYIVDLKKRLEHEQWSSAAAKKLQDSEFKDLIECALYFMEHDEKIVNYSPKFDEIVDWVEAMKDITRSLTNDNELFTFRKNAVTSSTHFPLSKPVCSRLDRLGLHFICIQMSHICSEDQMSQIL